MTKAIAEHAERYVLNSSDEDLRRLLTVSEITAETARRAFGRGASAKDGQPSTAAAALSAGLPCWRKW
jgi:hypothetical protein